MFFPESRSENRVTLQNSVCVNVHAPEFQVVARAAVLPKIRASIEQRPSLLQVHEQEDKRHHQESDYTTDDSDGQVETSLYCALNGEGPLRLGVETEAAGEFVVLIIQIGGGQNARIKFDIDM